MQGMKSQNEYYVPPQPGRYLSRIESAEAKLSKEKGNTMIVLGLKIVDPQFPAYNGESATDYIVTNANDKKQWGSKIKLRALGVFEMFGEIDDPVPDEHICQRLLGTQIYVDYVNEGRMSKGPSGQYDQPALVTDAHGNQVQLQNLKISGYARHPLGGAAVAQPVQQALPQAPAPQIATAPAQPQFQQGYAPQGQMMAPQGFAPQGQFVPQQQPLPMGAPQYAPPMGQPQQFAAAPPPWNGNGQVQQLPPAPATEATKGRKKLKVDAVDGE